RPSVLAVPRGALPRNAHAVLVSARNVRVRQEMREKRETNSLPLSPCGRGCRADEVREAGEGVLQVTTPHPAPCAHTLASLHPLPQGERVLEQAALPGS